MQKRQNDAASGLGANYGVFTARMRGCGVSFEGRDERFLPHEAPNDYARHISFDWGLFEVGAVFAAFTTILATLAVMVGAVPV